MNRVDGSKTEENTYANSVKNECAPKIS